MDELFFLDDDPAKAARYQCDRHVTKMVTECAQILSNVHWLNRYRGPEYTVDYDGPYGYTTMASPELKPLRWINDNLSNYYWAVEHGLALCAECERRYGRMRGCYDAGEVLEWLMDNPPPIPMRSRSPFMPATVKDHARLFEVPNDPVATSRLYYAFAVMCFKKSDEKGERAVFEEGEWKSRDKPTWIDDVRRATLPRRREEILAVLQARKGVPQVVTRDASPVGGAAEEA